MRIGIDYTAAVRQTAGIGRYARSLIRALSRLDHSNDYVLLSAGRDPSTEPWPANFRSRPLPVTDRHLSILWQKLRVPLPVEWLTGRLDLFHSPDFVLPPVRRARTVLTIHDLSYLRLPECSSPALLSYLLDAVPRSVARADLILADSYSTQQDLVELMSVPADRIRVIYPAVDATFSRAEPAQVAAVRARYRIDGPYILSLGTLQPRKNYVRLIQAFRQLREMRRVPHRLVIGGGPGWLHEPIYETIASLGLQDAVSMLGYVIEQDLAALYTGADVFAFPSLYEGFGIPVLEAMACGTPVVAANTSSLPEAAGDAALLVSPTDTEALAEALVQALGDTELRERLSRLGYEQYLRFSWEESARRLLDSYQSLVNGESHV
ncbi:MAG: glycosyltransferase family 4 protein [Anaerolineae bacterium]